MSKARRYEDEILKTVRAMPQEALPKVLQLVTQLREECRAAEEKPSASTHTGHEHTRRLLASSTTDTWAQTLLAARDDRW